MIVYAVAAEVSILKLFIAGVLPGILLIALFSGYIVGLGAAQPGQDPAGTPSDLPLREQLRRARHLIPCVLLIVLRAGVDVHRLCHRHRSRGVRRARRARHRLVERLAHRARTSATA